MKKVTLSLTALALVGFYAGSASAACDFNIAPARGIKGSMVRNERQCGGTEVPTPNSATEGGTPSCAPVLPATDDGTALGDRTLYSYDVKGGCSVTTQAKLLKSCAALEDSAGNPLGLEDKPCHVTFVSSKCKGILGTDGVTPISSGDDGWSLATLSRATLADLTNGDMTVIDFPVTFLYNTPDGGKMDLKSNSAEVLKGIVGANNADLPPCTSIEVVDVTIKDPDGRPFAKLGQATLPK